MLSSSQQRHRIASPSFRGDGRFRSRLRREIGSDGIVCRRVFDLKALGAQDEIAAPQRGLQRATGTQIDHSREFWKHSGVDGLDVRISAEVGVWDTLRRILARRILKYDYARFGPLEGARWEFTSSGTPNCGDPGDRASHTAWSPSRSAHAVTSQLAHQPAVFAHRKCFPQG